MKSEKGFTLIELLVVIFIIGILTAIILPNFVSSRERARDARRKSDLSEIRSALRLYYNDNQSYPDAFTFANPFVEGDTTYMQYVPDDPLSDQSYNYCVNGDNDAFVVCASLENAGDADMAESALRCPSSICSCLCSTNCYYVCGD